MIYYIDLKNGKKENNGLSEEKPLNDYKNLSLNEGDTVLFKCGTFVRDRLYNQNGVNYGAYGKGENPTFCGSVDVKNDLWEETEKNIWKYNGVLETEVCNFVYDNEKCGTLRWEKEELKEQGDFWDNCFGKCESRQEMENHEVYIFSKGNPKDVYKSMECVLRNNRSLAQMGQNMSFDSISFINNGVHAIAGEEPAKNIRIKNCEFRKIGGSVWSKKMKIRFGNGVECWDIAENITVENCLFDDIYDSAVTHQGGKECQPALNYIIKNNIFRKCGMGAYEQRDVMPQYAEFTGNICEKAGEGFSRLGEIMPRRSEIWPQPMGHHLFLWRIEKPTENGGIKIENNVFGDAIYGKAIYAIISEEAKKQLEIKNNECKGKFIGD